MEHGAFDLNSTDFDPYGYFLNLLEGNTLKKLVEKSSEVQNEIKSFDDDIQSIIFSNYNKFISSIDTVKTMTKSITNVEKKMVNLKTSVSKVNSLTLKVSSNLSKKRVEIQNLGKVNKDLSKLRQLCECPGILKHELKQYKTSINELLNLSRKKEITPKDYPTELLDTLGVEK